MLRHKRCSSIETQVVDVRYREGRNKRRRRCLKCNVRFDTYEVSKEEFELLMDAKERKQELESPIWAVIASDGVIATELTYSAAAKLVHDLQLVRQGITIVTQAVADKLKEQIASK